MTIEIGNITKIESGDFIIFIYQRNESPTYFDKSNAETLALILEKLQFIDIDLIYQFFRVLDGKHLTPQNWQKLVEMVVSFDPPSDEPCVFQEGSQQYIKIGGIQYPVELDKTLSPGEWHIKGRADDSR